MKSIKNIVALAVLSTISFGSLAQTITACASTLDDAEAQISAKAQEAGSSYKITEAHYKNGMHMTATLYK